MTFRIPWTLTVTRIDARLQIDASTVEQTCCEEQRRFHEAFGGLRGRKCSRGRCFLQRD